MSADASRGSVLVVDDEPTIGEVVCRYLQRAGYETHVALDGVEAVEMAAARGPDLVVLDLMLPRVDGLEAMRRIRALGGRRTPIILLTARGEESDRIIGLRLGADDYIVKPFGAAEVVARVRAVLRRTSVQRPGVPSGIEVGPVRVDLDTHVATLDRAPMELTLKEFELLRILVEHAGKVVSRVQLMDEVWDPHWYGSTKTLDVHISSLRRKLEDHAVEPRFIRTVRGVGFRFSSPEELDGPPTVSG
jgi:DNA-binding response OmpR family regulator